MADYLERYQQGECVQVWQELVALGDQVRAEPLYSAARAVAQETMRRARHNIDLLVGRLHNIGFQFQDTASVFVPTTAAQLNDLAQFEQQVGLVPLALRAWIEQVGTVNFMGTYPRLSYYDANTNPLGRLLMGGPQGGVLDIGQLLQDLSASDAVPSQVKDVFAKMLNTTQPTPQKPKQADIPEAEQAVSDPLVVDLYTVSLDAYEEWQEYEEEDTPFCATIAPDIFHKSNISGGDGYEIELPNAAADAILRNTEWRTMTLVEYLRFSFEWAGFPGLQDYAQRDEQLLASLKEGLLPL